MTKYLTILLVLLIACGSLGTVDAGKRHKRDRTTKQHPTGVSINGGPIIADTHDGVQAAMWANPMRFTAAEVPVYLYVDDVVFARQQASYDDLTRNLAKSEGLPRFTLYQRPWQSCAWVDADRANKPVQSISVCAESDIVRGLAGHVTMWYSKWPDVLGRVMMHLDTEQAASWQGLHCHEMMHAVGGVLDDYNADPEGSCIYGWRSSLGSSDIAFLAGLYAGKEDVPQLSSGVGVQIDQSGHVDSNKKKKRKKRR
jgi:hypothetical protein